MVLNYLVDNIVVVNSVYVSLSLTLHKGLMLFTQPCPNVAIKVYRSSLTASCETNYLFGLPRSQLMAYVGLASIYTPFMWLPTIVYPQPNAPVEYLHENMSSFT